MDISLASIKIGDECFLSIRRNGERSASVVRITGPVSSLDRVEGIAERQRIDMSFEVGLSDGGRGAQRRGRRERMKVPRI
jgi:hypothetical protein